MAMTLSPHLERRIQRVVASGRFESPEQALESAITRLEREANDVDLLPAWTNEDLQAAIDAGLDSLRNEPLVTPEEARAHLAELRAELLRA